MDSESFKALVDKKDSIEALLSIFDARLLFFGALVLFGIAGETWYGVRSWYNNRELRKVQRQIDSEREAIDSEKERQSKLAIAKLEKETTDAKLELARIDPVNLPIKTIHADVFVTISGDFSKKTLGTPIEENFVLSLEGNDGRLSKTDLVRLHCSKCEGMTTSRGAKTRLTLTMAFEWPEPGFVSTLPMPKSWVERTNASTRALDINISSAVISAFFLQTPGEIESGTCWLTINGSLRRDFALPKNIEVGPAVGEIRCTPIAPK